MLIAISAIILAKLFEIWLAFFIEIQVSFECKIVIFWLQLIDDLSITHMLIIVTGTYAIPELLWYQNRIESALSLVPREFLSLLSFFLREMASPLKAAIFNLKILQIRVSVDGNIAIWLGGRIFNLGGV